MKIIAVLSICLALGLAAVAQSAVAMTRGCVSFVSDSDDHSKDQLAEEPLHTAVTLSGDFDFYSTDHSGCWSVHVVVLPLELESGLQSGWVVSYVVTDPSRTMWYHSMMIGPKDGDVFDKAMRDAAATTIENIRFLKRVRLKSDRHGR